MSTHLPAHLAHRRMLDRHRLQALIRLWRLIRHLAISPDRELGRRQNRQRGRDCAKIDRRVRRQETVDKRMRASAGGRRTRCDRLGRDDGRVYVAALAEREDQPYRNVVRTSWTVVDRAYSRFAKNRHSDIKRTGLRMTFGRLRQTALRRKESRGMVRSLGEEHQDPHLRTLSQRMISPPTKRDGNLDRPDSICSDRLGISPN